MFFRKKSREKYFSPEKNCKFYISTVGLYAFLLWGDACAQIRGQCTHFTTSNFLEKKCHNQVLALQKTHDNSSISSFGKHYFIASSSISLLFQAPVTWLLFENQKCTYKCTLQMVVSILAQLTDCLCKYQLKHMNDYLMSLTTACGF